MRHTVVYVIYAKNSLGHIVEPREFLVAVRRVNPSTLSQALADPVRNLVSAEDTNVFSARMRGITVSEPEVFDDDHVGGLRRANELLQSLPGRSLNKDNEDFGLAAALKPAEPKQPRTSERLVDDLVEKVNQHTERKIENLGVTIAQINARADERITKLQARINELVQERDRKIANMQLLIDQITARAEKEIAKLRSN